LPAGEGEAFEVRAFFPVNGTTREDPVTGSLNASLAQWLLSTGRARAPYTARQGTAVARRGRVRIEVDDEGQVWTGGGTITCVRGEAALG
jgi:predicted PhzF superfamily epimerase YddE/YHI9